ncbi:hypothetical protein KY386_01560 [Candidatus Parcubacteria bacterium]|nr:hypothetical protein [Candidatus Parcubacteria bacterium]
MKLIQQLIEFVAPLECLGCGREGGLVCRACLPGIIITKRPTCYRCNRLSPGGRTCLSCRPSTKLSGVTVASHYEGAVKALIGALKYQRAASAAGLAAALITPLLKDLAIDVVTSTPASAGRYRQRGYNQAQLVAKAVAKSLNLPYADLLIRTGNAHQVGTSRQQRLKQVQGAFEPRRPYLIQDTRILLVDDVVTTGATMAECAKALKGAGAKHVWGTAIAKH